MNGSRPIGIFDSGLGGLTVFKAVRELLPDESLIYLGDTARVPYGIRSAETIIRYSGECCTFLAGKNVKAIVIACNTASAHALPSLMGRFSFPLLGVIEPGVKAALAASVSQSIGVIGTPATIASNAYAQKVKEGCARAHVVSLACPLFVPLVEEGWIDNEVTEAVVRRYLGTLRNEKIDTLILGCTHYPLLKNAIAATVNHGVKLIDSAEEVAKTLQRLLTEKNLLEARGVQPTQELYVTDLPARFETIASRFLGTALPPIKRIAL